MNRSEFGEMFARIERTLWRHARVVHPNYQRGGYDGWVLCPRVHALAHLRCIVEFTSAAYPGLPGMRWLAQQQFRQMGRCFDGDDLVFAVGDVQ